MVCVHTITNLFSSSYALHKANMLLPCYIILFIPEPSISFSMLCNYVTCDCDICYTYVMHCDM